jgi:hypothetical protein
LRQYTTDWTVAVSIPDEVIGFLSNLPNLSNRTTDLGFTQLLTEMGIGNHRGVKERPARKADNLTAICEPIIEKM